MAGRSGPGTQSRRKQTEQIPARKPLNARKIGIQVGVLALVVILFFVARNEGGAPQTASTFRATAQVEAWNFIATDGSGQEHVVCSDRLPGCDPDTMWGYHAAHATCETTADLWLAGVGMPLVVHGVKARLNATAWSGDYAYSNNSTQPLNVTTDAREDPTPWTGGMWWRPESEILSVRVPVPCDAHRLNLVVFLSGTGWTGETWSDDESAIISFHTAYLDNITRPDAQPT